MMEVIVERMPMVIMVMMVRMPMVRMMWRKVVSPDKTNSRWLEMQKPRGSRTGLRETINLPLLRS